MTTPGDVLVGRADTVTSDQEIEHVGRVRLTRATGRDFLVLGAWTVLMLIAAVQTDALERIVDWSQAYEDFEIDELLTVFMIAPVSFSIFIFRRLAELRAEIGARNEAENRMRHIALHDALTGLPNRVLFRERLETELARVDRDGVQLAVLYVDLDRFKQINDVFGHSAGDALLREAARRLHESVRRMDTVSRLGGDEFAIIQPAVGQPEAAAALAQRIVNAFSQPFTIEGEPVVISASVGIALGSHGDSPEDVLRASDIALYRAKADGRCIFRFFEPAMDAILRDRQELERDLRSALDRSDLDLHYQPIIEMAGRTVVGFEALLRWTHPVRGPISPVEFIPIAEDTGLILKLGEWVLLRACRDALAWPADMIVAVNLSVSQFKHRDLTGQVRSALERTGLPANRLELEITENVLIQDTEATLETLNQLRQLGVGISMDDFGTGYSSLSYLRKFPFDKIKLDRSFVSGVDDLGTDAAIVRTVLSLARDLGMTATAEGVETQDQLIFLRQEGCPQVQGFLIGRPMPQEQLRSYLDTAGAGDDGRL